LSHKTEDEDSTRRCGDPGLFNRPGEAVRPPGPVRSPEPVLPPRGAVLPPWSPAPRCFEAEDTRRDRKACIEAKQVAVAGHPSDEENLKTSKSALEGLVSLVLSEWVAANYWNPSSFVFPFSLSFSLVFPRTSLRASCEI
jgi:hypothetical protein